MRRAIQATERAGVCGLGWKSVQVSLPLRTEPEWSEAELRKLLEDTGGEEGQRIRAALSLAWIDRVRECPVVDVNRLRLGPVDLLFLPGESFVEYQLYAQGLAPDRFVAVAAYGESGPGYVCTDGAFAEGGYEPSMSRVGPPTEHLLKSAISELLR
jgi:hypothetical protein